MKLKEEFILQGTPLKNRVVMAPMTRSRAIGNVPNALMAEYYAQRASAGLLITEGTAPSAQGLGYARIPGIYNTDQIEGWKLVTKAIHDKGGKVFIQLMHTGRVSHAANMEAGTSIVAPSAIQLSGMMWTDAEGMQPYPTPKELTLEEIAKVQQDFVQAAKNAIAAGFDGVEIHAANGYLLNQFINTATNKRTDHYGGSIENRLRFVVETTEKIVAAIGKEKVGMRISPYGAFNDMEIYDSIDETYLQLTRELVKFDIAYLHLAEMTAPGIPAALKAALRDTFKGAIILCGGYDSNRAEYDLDANSADLIGFGRPFISNPDLPKRLFNGIALAAPKEESFYTPDAVGFTDYESVS